MQKKYLFYIAQNYSFAILRPVQKIILARGDDVKWFIEGNNVNVEYFAENESRLLTVEDINIFSPDAILYPSNIAPTFLPGVNVAVFHGFDAGKLDKKGHNDHYKIRNCFDLYCTQGPAATSEFKKLSVGKPHFNVIETGWCALDRLYEKPVIKNERPVILMCSTFSSRLSCAEELFETVKKLSRNNQWQWLIQFHPKMHTDTITKYKSIQNENLIFIETDDVIPLLQKADVMVCDTSSVLIMFLLLNKPVVTFKNISPGDYLIDIDDKSLLESAINSALLKPDELMTNILAFIDQTHPYSDGKSSQRLLDAIDKTLAEKSLLAKKPIDFIRNLKMRKKLNYWKF